MGGSIVDLKVMQNPITSFYAGTTQPMEIIELIIKLENQKSRDSKVIKTTFNIVDLPLTYNEIIRRPILYEIGAATSIIYLILKIPIGDRVITIKGD